MMDPGFSSLKALFTESRIWHRITWQTQPKDEVDEQLSELAQKVEQEVPVRVHWEEELIGIQYHITNKLCSNIFASVTELLSNVTYYEQRRRQALRFLFESRWIPSEADCSWMQGLLNYSSLAKEEMKRRIEACNNLLQTFLGISGFFFHHLEESTYITTPLKKIQWLQQHIYIVDQLLYAIDHSESANHFSEIANRILLNRQSTLNSQHQLSQPTEFIDKLKAMNARVSNLRFLLPQLYLSIQRPSVLYSKILFPLTRMTLFVLPLFRFVHSFVWKDWNTIYEDTKEILMNILSFMKEHIVDPLSSIYRQVFHHRYLTTNEESIERGRQSIQRMVESLEETAALLQVYEKNIQHPWYSLAFGELSQVLLIQLQKLKVDVEEQMLTLNQLVRANEINLQLFATIPGFLILYCVYQLLKYFYYSWKYQKIQGMNTPAKQVKWWLLAMQQSLTRLIESATASLSFYQQCGTYYYYCYAIEWLVVETKLIPFSSSSARDSFVRDVQQLCSPNLSIDYKSMLVQQILVSYQFLQVYFS
eukprot:jgi/Galph1/2273/GphlegSOOS_G943.1